MHKPSLHSSRLGLIVLTILLAFLPSTTFSQTEVSGEVSGEWTAEDSPYIVVDSTWVPEDEELRIGPGVDVLFGEGLGLDVFGTLTAEGSEEDSVRFLPQEEDVVWRGINFNNPGIENIFTYCAIRNAEIVFALGERTLLQIDNCDIGCTNRVIDNYNNALDSRSNVVMDYCRLYSTGHLFLVWISGYRFTANNCEIIGALDNDGNEGLAALNDWGGVCNLENSVIFGSIYDHAEYTSCYYSDCEFNKIAQHDVLCLAYRGFLRECEINVDIVNQISHDFDIIGCNIIGTLFLNHYIGSITGCQLDGGNVRIAFSNVDIRDCNFRLVRIRIMSDNNVDIYNCSIIGLIESRGGQIIIEKSFLQSEFLLLDWTDFQLINNTIILPGEPQLNDYTSFEMYVQSGETVSVVSNNIIYMTDSDEESSLFFFGSTAEENNLPITNYNCFYGYDNLLHEWNREADLNFELNETNIIDDPLFVSYDPLDPHLEWNSPCIDAGDPRSPRDPDRTRADIGAYYFDINDVKSRGAFDYPSECTFFPAYPNPFNSEFTIQYSLNSKTATSFELFDIFGRKVVYSDKEINPAGHHVITIDAKNLSSGNYILRFKAGSRLYQQNLILLR
jgi:hypothetical protein